MENFSKVAFEKDLVRALGIEGGDATEDYLLAFLRKYFGEEQARKIRETVSQDLNFFRTLDPASANYTEMQILSVRRGMAAITAQRIFHQILSENPRLLYDIEVIAKYVQKDTNVEIHPSAKIGVPFAIDHGHSTVIGATAELGKRAFIYHGVTLGASKERSKTQRRHPRVGDDAYFGNGSQVLGPVIMENDVHLSCGVVVRDCYLGKGVRIALGVRVAEVIVPENILIVGSDNVNLRRYATKDKSSGKIDWHEFETFVPSNYE